MAFGRLNQKAEKDRSAIALIPARGGSKRILRKNIRLFAGRPIISYSIEAARKTELFDDIIVSTDSEQIAEIARDCGASVPFLRPANLSDDAVPMAAVVGHALRWARERALPLSYICCIYATAPLLRPEFIIEGLKMISSEKVSAVIPVATFPSSIFRAFMINDEGTLKMYKPEYEMTRTNDLQEAYRDACQFYWLDADRFEKQPKIYRADALPLIIPRYLVQDIDTDEDWVTAEKMSQAFCGSKE